MRAPDVSVIVPTRNRRTLLAQTLRSVLAQDVSLEVIVVDEASTDDTQAWLAELRDPRVRTIRHQAPRGLPSARNAGVEASHGRWVAFVDDDDLWLPDKLPRQLAAASRQDSAWVYGGCLDVTIDGRQPRLLRVTTPLPGAAERLPWVNVVPGGGSNAVLRRALFDQVGGFDSTLRTVEDWDLWIRLAEVTSPAVVTDPVMAYRFHPDNMSKKLAAMLEGMEQIDVRYRRLRDGGTLDWEDAYRWLGGEALRSGDRAGARSLAWRALRAGHPGALRRLVRASIAVRARLPVQEASPTPRAADRFRPAPVVPWPEGTEADIRRILALGGGL